MPFALQESRLRTQNNLSSSAQKSAIIGSCIIAGLGGADTRAGMGVDLLIPRNRNDDAGAAARIGFESLFPFLGCSPLLNTRVSFLKPRSYNTSHEKYRDRKNSAKSSY